MTKGEQIDECAKRISALRGQLEHAFQMRNTFRRNDALDRNARRLIVVIVRELRLYRMRIGFISQGHDYGEQLARPFITPHYRHYN